MTLLDFINIKSLKLGAQIKDWKDRSKLRDLFFRYMTYVKH